MALQAVRNLLDLLPIAVLAPFSIIWRKYVSIWVLSNNGQGLVEARLKRQDRVFDSVFYEFLFIGLDEGVLRMEPSTEPVSLAQVEYDKHNLLTIVVNRVGDPVERIVLLVRLPPCDQPGGSIVVASHCWILKIGVEKSRRITGSFRLLHALLELRQGRHFVVARKFLPRCIARYIFALSFADGARF